MRARAFTRSNFDVNLILFVMQANVCHDYHSCHTVVNFDFKMGNWFSTCSCTKAKDSDFSLKQEVSSAQENVLAQKNLLTHEKRKKKKKKGKRNNRSRKTKSSRSSEPKEKLSVESLSDASRKSQCLSEGIPSTVDLTLVGHAIPILQEPVTPDIDPGASNAKIIVVEPSATSEHSSEETFPGGRFKRPITGSESNASLSSQAAVEKSNSNGEQEELEHDQESGSPVSQPQASEDRDAPPERNSQFRLLELLKIRLDMAANNMEINRLMANVDRALERTARTRELGFRRILAARARVSRRVHSAQESQEETADEDADGEETGTDGEDTEGYFDNDESCETPPPPPPRMCWQ